MASTITHYDDFYASSSWARSVDTISCVRRSQYAPNPPANSLGWCAAYLRLSSGSSDGAPHIFGSRSFRMMGKLLLPTTERKAAAKKIQQQSTNDKAPANKTTKRMPERPPQHLPKRLPLQPPQLHRTWQPRLPRKQSDSTRGRRRRAQQQNISCKRSHCGGQHGRPLKKPQQQLALG